MAGPLDPWFTASAVLTAFTGGVQPWATDKLSKMIGSWLFGHTHARWARYATYSFGRLFDNLFATKTVRIGIIKHLSLPTPLRAMLASLVAVIVLMTWWYFSIPVEYNISINGSSIIVSRSGETGSSQIIYVAIFGLFIGNCVVDYLSLIETRYVIRLSLRFPRRTFVYIAADLIFTCLLFVTVATIFMYVAVNIAVLVGELPRHYTIWQILDAQLAAVLSAVHMILSFDPDTIRAITRTYSYSPEGAARFILDQRPEDTFNVVWFLSTFVTSAWIWVHFGITFLVGLGRTTGRFMAKLSQIIRVYDYPLVALNIAGLAVLWVSFAIKNILEKFSGWF